MYHIKTAEKKLKKAEERNILSTEVKGKRLQYNFCSKHVAQRKMLHLNY